MKSFKELVNESKTVTLKSISKKPLSIKEIKTEDRKGNWLVVLNDDELNYYFNRNSWWTRLKDNSGQINDYQYGKYETERPLDFSDQQIVAKLAGINLV